MIDVDDDEGCKKIVPLEYIVKTEDEAKEVDEKINEVGLIKTRYKRDSTKKSNNGDNSCSNLKKSKQIAGTKRKRESKATFKIRTKIIKQKIHLP